ncbi:hypothetical protein EOD42_15170 [Rhodovarius crocodyli]|uniref:Lipoprotein n=1 Tax=Rhodovarius crocodyli TaxID=1979269 RepID=A0A437MD83_9PROT|nr:hypothetical protein [Rhodovarius crocodyli]RVT95550.1 hypothetical protein EOD42_15170 [Rhodovarius crocodyli]
MRKTIGALATLGLLGLASCSPGTTEDLLLVCPRPSLLPDAVDLTRYRQGQVPELTSLEIDARLMGFTAPTCRPQRDGRGIAQQFSLQIAAERGPAGTPRTQTLPLVVAVTNAQGQVLNRRVVEQSVSFQANTTSTRVTSEPVEIVLPVSQAHRARDYRIVIGFLLTEQELAANRRRGPR